MENLCQKKTYQLKASCHRHPEKRKNGTFDNSRRIHTLIFRNPENGRFVITLKYGTFSSVVCLWIGTVRDCDILHALSASRLFWVFKRSQFFNIVNESDEKFDDSGILERNTILADICCNDDRAGHNAEFVRLSSGSTHSSSDEVARKSYRTDVTVYGQYEEGSC